MPLAQSLSHYLTHREVQEALGTKLRKRQLRILSREEGLNWNPREDAVETANLAVGNPEL